MSQSHEPKQLSNDSIISEFRCIQTASSSLNDLPNALIQSCLSYLETSKLFCVASMKNGRLTNNIMKLIGSNVNLNLMEHQIARKTFTNKTPHDITQLINTIDLVLPICHVVSLKCMNQFFRNFKNLDSLKIFHDEDTCNKETATYEYCYFGDKGDIMDIALDIMKSSVSIQTLIYHYTKRRVHYYYSFIRTRHNKIILDEYGRVESLDK